MARRLGIAALALLVAGCLPIPHRRSVSPAISGRLVDSGRPLASVRVSRCVADWNCSCNAADEAVATDAGGYFELPERHQWYAFLSPDDTTIPPVLLCYGGADSRVLWQSRGRFPDRDEILACEIGMGTRCELIAER